MDTNHNRKIGADRLNLTLHYVQRFGNLNAKQLALLICPNMPENNGRFTVSRMCEKAVKKGFLIERFADGTNVRHWFIGLKGVRYLRDELGYHHLPLKSGKEGAITIHRTACNDALISLATSFPKGQFWTDAEFYANPNNSWVVPVQSKRSGGHGKQPDGLFLLDGKVYWLEVENSRRGGKGMAALCKWLLNALGNAYAITLNNQSDLMLDYVLIVSINKATASIGNRIEKWFDANHPLTDSRWENINSRLKFMHIEKAKTVEIEHYLPSWRSMPSQRAPHVPSAIPPVKPPIARKPPINYAALLD